MQKFPLAKARPTRVLQHRSVMFRKILFVFALFFGAGNLIFPLQMGVNASWYLLPVFLVSSLGLPLMGLLVMAQYQGDPAKFFQWMPKYIEVIICILLLLFIGPLLAMPRCIIMTYSFASFMPMFMISKKIFILFYILCILMGSASFEAIMQILQKYFVPIKFVFLFLLVVMAIFSTTGQPAPHFFKPQNPIDVFVSGYNTLDLLPTIFFSNMIFALYSKKQELVVKQVGVVSAAGLLLLACFYTMFFYIGHKFSFLYDLAMPINFLPSIATYIFGSTGSYVLTGIIFIATLTTCTALLKICFSYFYTFFPAWQKYHIVFLVLFCLLLYTMSLYNFAHLSHLLLGIMQFVYPGIVLIFIMNSAKLLFKNFNV
jgi:branched-chain amino acid:cation transporter, LIVCS family